MQISNLDPKALARLRPSELADLALAADQESRRLARMGDAAGAQRWDTESARLAAVFRSV